MLEQENPCTAPEHVPNCSGIGETRDHFTPVKVIAITKVEPPDNIQRLSKECHKAKDLDTAKRIELLKLERDEGIIFSFDEHRRIFAKENSLQKIT